MCQVFGPRPDEARINHPMSKSDTFTYLSLGAGVQSTALLVLSDLGMQNVPRADVAIFADTGDEPSYIYEYLEVLKEWSSIPIEVASAGCISADIIAAHAGRRSRFAAIPAFTLVPGEKRPSMLRRQCTREYKVAPIEQCVRKLLGYTRGKHVKHDVHCMLGISLDETTRMKPSRTPWITNHWPLVDAKICRQQCVRIVEGAGLPTPHKSSCVFCPYKSNAGWRKMKRDYPQDFARACAIDEQIRDMTKSGVEQPVYVHRSAKPLAQANLDEDQMEMFENDCEGHCGV